VTSSRSLLLLIAALAVGAALTQARASPLDADTCNKMMVEQGTLETAGVEQDLAKGPEWAKSNLSADKIAQIRRFIELEELILFRCRSKSRVVLRPDPEEQEAKEREAKEKEAREKEAKEKDQAKDGQHKGAATKQETVFPKTAPRTAKPNEPAPPVKTDTRKSKAQEPQKAGKTVERSGAAPKVDPKAQPKAARKQDHSGADAQAKAAPHAPKTGAAPQKSPAKAKAEAAPKDE
jgi:hypothetical protein